MSERQGIIVGLASARGGVGRAMAVANVGALLAQKGKRVLVVDLAVDEPALERYFQGRGEGRRGAGVVGFFEAVRASVSPLTLGRARETPPEAAVRAGVTQLLEGAGIRVVPLKLGGAPAEVFYWPAEGARSAVARGRVIEECPWLLAPLGQALRARYDEVLVNVPSGRTEATALLAAHLVDKLVLLVDDASLEEAIELGRFAHARRTLVDAGRPLAIFPLLVRVEEGASGRAFVEEAKEQLEGLIYETTHVMGRDLGPYLGLATIPWNERAARGAAIAAEIESTADPKSLAHAYLRFVQCLRRQSPLDVGEAARPSSRDLWAAIEARRGRSGPDSSPPSSRLFAEDRGSSPPPPPSRVPPSVRFIEGDPFVRAAALRAEGNVRAARKVYLDVTRGEVRDEGGSREAARALVALGDLSIESGEPNVSEYSEVIRRFFPRRFEDREFLTSVLLSSYRQGKFHAGREQWAEACKHLGMALELGEEMRLVEEPPWLAAVLVDAAHAAGVCCQELGWDDTAVNHFAMACAAAQVREGIGFRAVEAASLCGTIFSAGRLGNHDRALEAAAELARRASTPAAASMSAAIVLGAANAAATLALAGHVSQAAAALGVLRERLAGVKESPHFEVAAAVACNEVTVLDAAGRHEEAAARMAEVRARLAGSLHLPVLSALCAAECSHAITLATRGEARRASEALFALRERLGRVWLRLDAGAGLIALLSGVSYSLSCVLEREGRVDEARAALAEASLRARWDDPRRPRILGRAGLALLRVAAMLQGFGVTAGEASFELARRNLREAAEHDGSDPVLLGSAGILALIRADEDEARGLLEKAYARGGEAVLARALCAVRAAMKPHDGGLVREIGARIESIPAETREALRALDPSGLAWLCALAGATVSAPRKPVAAAGAEAAESALERANTRAIRTHASPVCRPDTSLGVEPPIPWLSCPLLLLERQDEGGTAKASPAPGRARDEAPEAPPRVLFPAPIAGPVGDVVGALGALYAGTLALRAAVRRTSEGGEEATELVDAFRGEDGEPVVRVFADDPAEEVLITNGSEASLVRRGYVITRSTIEETPYVALVALLGEGLGRAFDVVVSGEEARPWMAVIAAVPRKQRAGCARARIEVDRVLVARGDLGAIRRVMVWDTRGVEHRFTVEGIARVELGPRDCRPPARSLDEAFGGPATKR